MTRKGVNAISRGVMLDVLFETMKMNASHPERIHKGMRLKLEFPIPNVNLYEC